jgi:CHAD domain-containing protein
MLAESGQQMTTDRTAIRRWLEVGGGAHRPPIRVRKGRHRSIVAPLAATLAATAAVGLGVVLARAGNERRRRRGRRLGLWPEESLGTGLRRMAVEQAELAIAEIDGATPETIGRAVHNARKSIKRLRTIVRLLEGQLGPDVCAREQASLRAAASGLAQARDAEVMLATLEGLIERHGGGLGGKRQIKRLRARLAEDRDRAERRVLEPAARISATHQLRAFRSRAADWKLIEEQGIGSVDSGLRRIYRQGRGRRRRAARKGAGMRAMHQWRKRVKDLRYGVEVLQRSEPSRRGSRSRRERARAEARWLARTAKRAEEVGELLGEEHDLAVLGQWLRAEGKRHGLKGRTRRRLEKLITGRRAELRRRALRQSGTLYRRSPEQFMARLRLAFERTGPKRLS